MTSSRYSIVVCNCDIYFLDSGDLPSHGLLYLRPSCSCKIYWMAIWFITFRLVVNASSGSRIFSLFSYAWEKDLPKSSLHVPILANRCYMAQCHSMIPHGEPCRYVCVFIDLSTLLTRFNTGYTLEHFIRGLYIPHKFKLLTLDFLESYSFKAV